jgi:putative tryptophan/tyrosine transport system substrate-binding protein
MMNRRRLLAAIGLCAIGVPSASFAQQPARIPRIGFLGAVSARGLDSRIAALRAGLLELGYVEGRNIAIEFRWANDRYERLPELAAELVGLKVEVIVTHAAPGIRAAMQASATIPIVMAVVGDAVASGFVASLARPGGNVTGSSYFNPELCAKRLEILKDAFPRARRVGFVFNPDNVASALVLQAIGRAAKSLNVELQTFGVRGSSGFEGAFAAMAKGRVDAAVFWEDPVLVANARGIADLALKNRLPTVGFEDVAQAGGLIAYGVNFTELYRRAATFVDKILKGARPGDLPVEQATRFETLINMKTAKALGVTIPKSILLRADQVIE